jgi:hypothetical protein
MPPKPAYRVTVAEGSMLIVIAVIADAIQILFKFLWLTGILAILSEAVGWAVSGLAIFLLTVGFTGLRVKPLAGPRQKVRGIITVLFEGMPLLNLVPTFTVWTVLTIRQSRAEDREKAVQSATIAQREEALRRGALRRTRRGPGLERPGRRMRPVLRSIPNPAFKAASVALTTKESGGRTRGPHKNAL